MTIDVAGHAVKRDDVPVSLTPLEFDLLVALARKPRQVFTREVLLEQVWDEHADPFTNTVTVTIGRLRRKLGDPPVIATTPGVGYRVAPL